ncbi:lamin tail domain-containing protein [Fibrella sp. HMF5335]|uniref:Lamin tail domain-containing protein n=1 Tax=Fibrella rubiginis TaxID=2817060 RepID=A0A939GG26_9BACT|nr:lamin tail domain-containing protein [Fibrella rubiginis]MBO0936584.1 lamin tail domain-containing protein [Fibrella rubiginis]
MASAPGSVAGQSRQLVAPMGTVSAGSIRITEFMYDGKPGEFIELTNVGDAAVNMTNWRFEDENHTNPLSLSKFGVVYPGESVIITEATDSAFHAAWGLPSTIKVIGDNTTKLGGSDEINIYDNLNSRVDYLKYSNSTANGTSFWASLPNLGKNDPTKWQKSVVNDIQRSFTTVTSPTNTGNPGRYSYRTSAASPLIQATQTTPYIQLATYSVGFVSGVLNDPTDPVSTLGTSFSISDTDTPASTLVVSVTSNNAAVVPNGNLIQNKTVTGSGLSLNLKFAPVGVGYATISVMVSDGSSSDTYLINYAASAASQNPTTSRFHAGTSDGSTAINIDADYMLVGDDENQTIRLYNRKNSGTPVNGFDFASVLDLYKNNGKGKEVDIEGSTRTGNRIFWIGSQSNNEEGESRVNRNRVFVTTVSGTGASTSLSYGGRYDYLRDDLLNWDAGNKHGKGANYYGLVASAASGVDAKQAAGYNIEGLELAPLDSAGYICFRAPLIPTNDRYKALIVPVTNFTALVTSTSQSLPAGSAKFGKPIEMDLGVRGIREMRRNSNNEYIIIAGPPGTATDIAPNDFRLYTWNGDPASFPILRDADLTSLTVPGSFEGIVDVPNPLKSTSSIQFLMDNGVTQFYNDGTATKDLPQPLFKKFRSELVGLGGETPPPLAWQKALGGTGSEGSSAGAITPTSDGGYVLAGSTSSTNNGDVGVNHGGVDAWIVRVNSVGSIVWQKTVGGS